MRSIRWVAAIAFSSVFAAGCASTDARSERSAVARGERTIVGTWELTSKRPTGVGAVLATFASDGTFLRSGDTHPNLSVGHGVWRRVGDGIFELTYVALRFDDARKHVGSQNVRVRITHDASGNALSALANVSVLDSGGKQTQAFETQLTGKRLQPAPF